MRRWIYVLLLTVFFSFAWGVWWGFAPPQEGLVWNKNSESLRVLAPKELFTPEFLAELKKNEKLTLKIAAMDSGLALLRELLSHEQKYDLVLFSSFLSDSIILDHYFGELNTDKLKLDREISVDFLQLNFDPNNLYSVPLLWGVNGWLVPKEKAEESFSLKAHSKLNVLFEPAELFGLATKLKPIVRSWVETGESKSLMGLKDFFKTFDPKKGVRQISSGALTEADLKDHVFRLAEERSHLWIIHAAITKNSPKAQLAEESLKLLLTPRWSEQLANGAQAATVNKRLEASQALPPYRKASYIRSLPMSQIEFFSSHEAYEPIFMSILQKIHPSVFN